MCLGSLLYWLVGGCSWVLRLWLWSWVICCLWLFWLGWVLCSCCLFCLLIVLTLNFSLLCVMVGGWLWLFILVLFVVFDLDVLVGLVVFLYGAYLNMLCLGLFDCCSFSLLCVCLCWFVVECLITCLLLVCNCVDCVLFVGLFVVDVLVFWDV